MQKRALLLLLCATIALPGQAKSEKRGLFRKKKAAVETVEEKPKETDYDKLLKKPHETFEGFVTMHKIDGKLYFEMPVDLLGREMLLGSTISETSNNYSAVPGAKSYEPLHIIFTRADKNVQMRRIDSSIVTDESGTTRNLESSLRKNNVPVIYKNFKLEAFNNDSTAVVFEVTDLFVSHVKELSPFSYFGFYGGSGSDGLSESFKKELSSLGNVKSFSDNLVVKSTLSYSFSVKNPNTGQTMVRDESLTAVMTRTLVLLDEHPYRPRITDSRMSVFPTGKYLLSDREQMVKTIYYANRWRLEPADMEAYRRGELTDPVKPIVFYIDPDFPELWKPAVYEGVNQWSELFEKIGFSNAIRAEDYPEDDPEFDPDNIKYSCIRYAPVAVANAMGPSWVDPRSGQILNASVYVYHDVVKMLNRMIFTQTAQTDERVRRVNLPDDVLLDGLRYVIAHEVGHCLGFMHNMSASSVIPVDSLRSPTFTQKYGTTTSIMDYARFNYVAQPGDMQRGVKLTPPRFGVYDEYALRWLYTPVPEAETAFDEYKVTSAWISDAMADPILRYGKQQFYGNVDPKSLTEDLGDDAIKASKYGIDNLKLILANLYEWMENDGDENYVHRKFMYDAVLGQYMGYIGHVYANIGGIYLNEKREGDPVDAFSSVPKERQREALRFMLSQLKDIEWLDNRQLLDRIGIMGSPKGTVYATVLAAVMNAPLKMSLIMSSQLSDDPYTPQQCRADIFDFVWEPTRRGRSLSKDEMMLQREFVKLLAQSAGIAYPGVKNSHGFADTDSEIFHIDGITAGTALCSCGADHDPFSLGGSTSLTGYGPPSTRYFTSDLTSSEFYLDFIKARDLIASRVGSSKGETRAHYQYLLHNINKSLKE